MLGLEHPRDILQVVGVDLLGAAPGEGHGDDTLRDVRQVQLVSLLHPESFALPVQSNDRRVRRPKALELPLNS